MSLWDPEAAGNAAQYLRLEELEMLHIRGKPFNSNQVWVPYADTGYTKAVIMDDQSGVKEGEVKIKRDTDMKEKARSQLFLHMIHRVNSLECQF